MKLGVVLDGQKNFIEEMLVDWQSRYQTSVFSFKEFALPVARGRLNGFRHRKALQNFINQQDVVFFEWAGSNLVIASQLKLNSPVVVRLHSWELYHHAQWVNWDAVTKIILVSQAMRRKFIDLHPAQAAKTVVLPAGKSITRFSPVDHPFQANIAMLGNLLPIKRVYEMVLTLAQLKKLGYNFTLHLGGLPDKDFNNQRYYASLQSAVKKLDLQEQVIFHGWIQQPEVWLRKMDVVVSNSFWEGQPNALVEAMAAGCYCLSHFWDGAEEILPEEYIYSTEGELVQKLIDYYCMVEEKRREHLAYLRSIAVEKYNLMQSGEKYREVLENAARRKAVG